MTTEEQVRNLSTLTTKDHARRHFTERYSDAVITELESLGLIEVSRPIHEATGLSWDQQYWTVEVTPEGVDLVQGNPEYWNTDN